jgi:glycine/D-amino acid oxidase-like deaminating enzyme
VGLELKMKAAQFYPPAQAFELIEVRAGMRTSRPKGYRPILQKISEKIWVFSGLGSRGMLYHAYLGKALAEAIYQKSPLSEIFKSCEAVASCVLTEV